MNHVVETFFVGLRSGDTELIVDLYDDGAVLELGPQRFIGRAEIEERLEAIARWLRGGDLVFGETNPTTVRWKVVGGPADGCRGTETYAVQNGRIVYHTSSFVTT